METNLIKYKPIVLIAINHFLANEIGNTGFLEMLKTIENLMRDEQPKKKGAGLWFKWFKGDVCSTTIDNIHADLYGSKNNYDYLIECLKIAVESDELEIYYS